MLISPREYQLEALESVAKAQFHGVTRQLISLPTGCGKTVVFSLLAKEINVKTLVLAHTEELISQAVSKFKIVWPEVDIGIVKAESDEIEAQVVVASIQTASKMKRLYKLKGQNFGLMIIDEAHHATAPSYETVIKDLDFFNNASDKLLVGVTATPKRGDGIGLGNIFQEIVFERSIHTMIRSGYLSPLKGKQVFTKVDLGKVGIANGDFITSQLSKMVNTPERNNLIVESYTQYVLGRKRTLAFCVDVQHAKDLARTFKEKGTEAKAVYGSMTREERAEALSGFSNGKYEVLTNCQLLTEGFDEPGIDCVIMGRPTHSSSLFTQMIGRGTRTSPLKMDCLVLDFTDNVTKHDLCTYKNTLDGAVDILFDVECKNKIDEYEESAIQEIVDPTASIKAELIKERVEEVNFFDNVHFAWNSVGSDWHLVLGSSRDVWVIQTEEGYFVKAIEDGVSTDLSTRALPLDYALGVAEDWSRNQTTKSAWARKDAEWRKERATEKQIDTLDKMGIKLNYFPSKGEAAELIDRKINAPATVKQLRLLNAKGVHFEHGITKTRAHQLIAQTLGG